MIPILIEMGVDLLDPVQVTARGMTLEELKNEFGGEIAFHGGISAQSTLVFGNVLDVRSEVRQAIEIMVDCGEYILAPDQNIVDNTPVDNIIAIYGEAYKK